MGARNPHTASGAYEFRIHRAYIIYGLAWPDLFLALGIIACSISAQWALILQAITPNAKKRSGHARLICACVGRGRLKALGKNTFQKVKSAKSSGALKTLSKDGRLPSLLSVFRAPDDFALFTFFGVCACYRTRPNYTNQRPPISITSTNSWTCPLHWSRCGNNLESTNVLTELKYFDNYQKRS